MRLSDASSFFSFNDLKINTLRLKNYSYFGAKQTTLR